LARREYLPGTLISAGEGGSVVQQIIAWLKEVREPSFAGTPVQP
jgi:hypothetical protein